MALPALMAAGTAAAGIFGADKASEAAEQQQAALDEAQRDQRFAIKRQEDLSKRVFQGQRAAYQDFGAQARGDLEAGFGQARGDIQGGLAGAQGALAEQRGLTGYAPGAAQALGAYDVMGQSRQQQMLSGNYDIAQDPGYQFRLQQGEQAIGRAASASGGRASGATLKALQAHGQGLAAQEYGAAFQRAGMADQMLLNQAGRQDMASLQAQRNQMRLAGLGFGAGQQIAGMEFGAGQNLAGLSTGLAQQQVGVGQFQTQGIADAYRTRLASGSDITNQFMGAAMTPTAAAGGQSAAWANLGQQGMQAGIGFMGQAAEAGASAAGQGAGGGGAPKGPT